MKDKVFKFINFFLMCLNRVYLSRKYPSKSDIWVWASGNTRLNRVCGYGCQLWVSYPYPTILPEFFQVHMYAVKGYYIGHGD